MASNDIVHHSPLPWKIGQYLRVLGTDDEPILVSGIALPAGNHPQAQEAQANAAFIVQAVNAHDGLVAACSTVHAMMVKWADTSPEYKPAILQVISILSDALIEAGHHD